jgi:hypothetical protein
MCGCPLRTIHQTAVEILIRKRKSNYRRGKGRGRGSGIQREREKEREREREQAGDSKLWLRHKLHWFLPPPGCAGAEAACLHALQRKASFDCRQPAGLISHCQGFPDLGAQTIHTAPTIRTSWNCPSFTPAGLGGKGV